MPDRWTVFDRILHDLGSLRLAADALRGTPQEFTVEAQDLFEEFERAAEAVHESLDCPDQSYLDEACTAIRRALESQRRAATVIALAQKSGAAARPMRSRTAQQREASKRVSHAREFGLLRSQYDD
jgi:hypothetical protein